MLIIKIVDKLSTWIVFIILKSKYTPRHGEVRLGNKAPPHHEASDFSDP